jgi:hypothetical protein
VDEPGYPETEKTTTFADERWHGAVIDEGFVVCQRLAPHWNPHLQQHGLSIDGQTPKALEDHLSASLDVDPSVTGFEDLPC